MHTKWKLPFFRFAGSQAFSIIGSGSVQFALTWWLTVETGSAIMLSIGTLAAFLPALLIGPFAGVLVDRFKRKTVIIAADIFIGIVSVLFAVYIGFTSANAITVCIVLFIRSLGTVFQMPAVQATITILVPRENLMQANGYNQFIQSGSNMLAPVLGAALYAMLPLPAILLFDLLGAIFASGMIFMMKINDTHLFLHKEKQHFFAEMKDGLLAFISDKKFIIVMLTAFFAILFYSPVSTLYPLMVNGFFGADEWGASLVEITFAVGMMLGAIVIGNFRIKNKLNFAMFGILLIGATITLYWVLPSSKSGFIIFLAASFLLGFVSNFHGIPIMSYMQSTIAPEKQGRAFALYSSAMTISMPIGLLILAPIAEKLGIGFTFGVAGLTICFIAILGIFALSIVTKKLSKGAQK